MGSFSLYISHDKLLLELSWRITVKMTQDRAAVFCARLKQLGVEEEMPEGKKGQDLQNPEEGR